MSDELAPVRCGCGGEAVVGYTESCLCYVECQKCETETRFFRTEAEAIEAWNRAMGGAVVAENATAESSAQDCAENARCSETAKVSKGAYDLMRCECGMPVSSNFDFCPRCRARLIWRED